MAANITLTIVERDGDTIYCVCSNGRADIEVITNATLIGSTLTLDGLHIDGPGATTFGIAELRDCARELGRRYGATVVEIRGGIRTTGSNPGHRPRMVRVRVW